MSRHTTRTLVWTLDQSWPLLVPHRVVFSMFTLCASAPMVMCVEEWHRRCARRTNTGEGVERLGSGTRLSFGSNCCGSWQIYGLTGWPIDSLIDRKVTDLLTFNCVEIWKHLSGFSDQLKTVSCQSLYFIAFNFPPHINKRSLSPTYTHSFQNHYLNQRTKSISPSSVRCVGGGCNKI